jgi:hypothetical protein
MMDQMVSHHRMVETLGQDGMREVLMARGTEPGP